MAHRADGLSDIFEHNVIIRENCTAKKFFGDGSALTGISSTESDPIFNAASAAYNSHLASNAIHFTVSSISIPASQISDFDTEVSNNTAVAANTAKTSYTDSTLVAATVSSLALVTADVADNTASCALIDPHIADSTIHFTSNALWADINANTASCALVDPHIASTAIHFTIDNIMGVQVHAADATVSRALSFDVVTWIGSVEPTYAADNDLWIDTS